MDTCQEGKLLICFIRYSGGVRDGGAGGSAHHRLKPLETGLSGMARETRCPPFMCLHCIRPRNAQQIDAGHEGHCASPFTRHDFAIACIGSMDAPTTLSQSWAALLKYGAKVAIGGVFPLIGALRVSTIA